MELYRIFSKQLAIKLREVGFKIVRTEVNRYKPEFDVYLFEDSTSFRSAMEVINHSKVQNK